MLQGGLARFRPSTVLRPPASTRVTVYVWCRFQFGESREWIGPVL